MSLPDRLRFSQLDKECYGKLGCSVLRKIMGEAIFDDGVVYSGNWAKQRVLIGHDNAAEAAGVDKDAWCESAGVCKFDGINLDIHGINNITVTTDK